LSLNNFDKIKILMILSFLIPWKIGSFLLFQKYFRKTFKTIIQKFNFNITYKPLNSLNHFIKIGKDRIKKEKHSHVVCQINCFDCNASYVSQIKRKLNTHLKEHKAEHKKTF